MTESLQDIARVRYCFSQTSVCFGTMKEQGS